MQEQDLQKKILDYIRETYEATYKGRIEVNYLNPGYELLLGIPSYLAFTTISADIDNPDDFYKFVCEELRVRNYVRKQTYEVIRTTSSNEER